MKAFEFARYFNPHKSPRTQFNYEKGTFDYFPKHNRWKGRVVWNSKVKGTYIKNIHGDL